MRRCGLLHEARPVTKERRHAHPPFLYDEEGSALRERSQAIADFGLEPLNRRSADKVQIAGLSNRGGVWLFRRLMLEPSLRNLPLEFLAVALALAAAGPVSSGSPEAETPLPLLHWPLACTVGQTCFIQHYVDHDLEGAPRDSFCGPKTYHGHDGVDIRLPDMAAQRLGVSVLAAAGGVVTGLRDWMPDVSVREGGFDAIKDRECGNGVMISHAGGWTTQYCHMRQGSLRVRSGQHVRTGDVLGQVGLSGDTEFPHLHLSVRLNGGIVDPFVYGAPAHTCGGGRSLWSADAGQARTYHDPEVLNIGFTSGSLTMATIEQGDVPRPGGEDVPAVVFYARVIGLEAGDALTLELDGANGAVLAKSAAPPLDHSKDQYMMFVGVHRPVAGWRGARLVGTFSVNRRGRIVASRRESMTL